MQDFAKARGEGASPRGEGWAQGTGDLSRIGYALGGTRARLGVLFVLPPGPLAHGHYVYSSDHSSDGLLRDRPCSGAGLGRTYLENDTVAILPVAE